MTRKTPEEISLEFYPVKMIYGHYPKEYDENGHDRALWLKGYTSNTELEEFKKELVEKLERLEVDCLLYGDIRIRLSLADVKHIITQEDQP
jgi:hypothetical protein